MKLSEWAKSQGLTYKTAWRMFHDGRLPVPARKLPKGPIIVQVESYSAVLEAALRLPKDDRKRIIRELEESI